MFFYDYFDNIDRLTDVRLPKQNEFFDKLEERKCTEREYGHPKCVWDVIDINWE